MGGKGGGAEIPQEVEDAARQLQEIGQQQFELGLPLLQEGGRQGVDILAGGQGALRPAILRTLEEGRRSGSQALVNLRESLTRQGITGTELQRRLAEAQQDVESGVSQIPFQFTAPVLQGGATEAFGLPAQGISNISQAISGGAASAVARPQAGGLLGALSGATGGGAAGLLAQQALNFSFPGAGAVLGGAGALLGGAKGAK